ncbi:DUF3472 domain-containing protein [Luteibacter jiangsuensis]|uniref:DUF3472 domain-containing protein n=1 Tax=Luteibacter jiangsuensis TaxID=637577 RepID=A0ABX0Q846_9GAMM|nr:DUF3472 domain-containing protein [Luteibacter jiangsuensis]NID05911.1 DUF3472 domain-containing protein [Luteibacter jiangsuensis]
MATQVAQVPASDPARTATFARNGADLLYVEQAIPIQGDVTHIFWLGRDAPTETRVDRPGLHPQARMVIGGVVFDPDRIASIWKLACPSLPPEVELEYGAPQLRCSPFGGEGFGVYASLAMPWTPGQWYGLAVRRWHAPWEDVTRGAIFIYSHAQALWMHWLTVAVRGANLKLTGTCCRHFRMLSGQGWEKPLDRSEAKPEPADANATVTHVTAIINEGALTVGWTILASAPPQLGARIWIEDEDRRIWATERVRVPHVREVTMDISGLRGSYRAHVVVEDIFDQDSNDGYAGFVC